MSSGSNLATLVALIDRVPLATAPAGRGRPRTYSDRLFLKALVIMIVKWLPTVPLLLGVLDQPTLEMQHLRALLREQGRYPSRRTFERRLGTLPETLPAQIACAGQCLLDLVQPVAQCGMAGAIDSTVPRANGGVWHKKDREATIVPHTSIDTDGHWTTSGWHGWVYGWKLHVVTTVTAVWLPLAAELTPANTADSELAFALLDTLDGELRFLLGDSAYNDPQLQAECEERGIPLVTTQRGPYPHTDDGVEVRRIFHQLRSHAIENFNGQFKGIFDARQPVPTRGLLATRRFALGVVLVYQLTVWHRFEAGDDLCVGLKHFIKAA